MLILIRVVCGIVGLGAATFLACSAYWCWEIAGNLGRGNLEFFGISVPFPLGMTLLIVLSLMFAIGGIYAFLFPASDN